MLSRTADHLYWMSRYTERAENTARMLNVSYDTSMLPQAPQAARKAWPGGYFVVPGVRPANGTAGDQKRIVTPAQAMGDGASILVVGRPISQSPDPDLAARAIEATL